MFLGDFHIHSTFSDGSLTIPEIVDLYGQHGFGAIAITDHICDNLSLIGNASRFLNKTLCESSFKLYREIIKSEQQRAWQTYGMLLIPGFEITVNRVKSHDSYHLIILGVDDFISANLPLEQLIEKTKEQNGLVIAAHPVHTGKIEKQTYYLWKNRNSLKNKIDAWEVASGKRFFSEVKESGLSLIANSDLHHRRHFHSWKTVFNCNRNTQSVFKAIKEQTIQFIYYQGEKHDLHNSSYAFGFNRYHTTHSGNGF